MNIIHEHILSLTKNLYCTFFIWVVKVCLKQEMFETHKCSPGAKQVCNEFSIWWLNKSDANGSPISV